MNDQPIDGEPEELARDDEDMKKTRRLIASVEELRALLAPLSPDEREQVLALARWLKAHPTGS